MLGTAIIVFREVLEAALIVSIVMAVTNWMILLLAAGMASQGAGFLAQADVLPPLGYALWDTSALLNEQSILGKILHTLVGYVSQPAGIQVLFYLATLAIIGVLMQRFGKSGSPRPGGSGSSLSAGVGAVLVIGLGTAATASSAHAEFKLRYPFVDYREIEFEHNGATTFDKSKSGKNNNQSYTYEVEVGATPYWQFGLEAETGAAPGENLRYEATTVENIFQLTPQGKYWADLGFFAEYSHAASRRDADSFTFGPLIQKELYDVMGTDTVHTLNLLFSKEVGRNRTDDTPFFYAWQSRLRLDPHFEPGIEVYGQVENIEAPGKLADQQHRVGPVVVGLHSLAPYGKIKYEVGYLFGLTHATENGAVRWRFEYEIPF